MGAFGTTYSRPDRQWRAEMLLETYQRLRPGGIPRDVSAVTIGDQVLEVEHEWWSGGRCLRRRPKFRCPDCGRGCKYLHQRDGRFVCRLCSGLDYSSRHRRRWGPIDMIIKLRTKIGADPTPFAALVPTSRRRGVSEICARIAAKEAVLASKLERMASDLSKRAERL